MLRELTEPFDALTAAEASGLLAEHWGIDATALERLDTERDDSFRVISGESSVLKVAHPLDDAALIDLQVAAMERAGLAGLPVQRSIAALDGSRVVNVNGRLARVITWIPGTLLRDAGPGYERVAGGMLARLGEALRDFEHSAAQRTFAWDLQSFDALRELGHPVALDAVFERFAALELSELPHQVIHNDFHPGNLLVADGQITGILDFGDTVFGPRVQDAAVALAYLVPETGDPARSIDEFVAGYATLSPAELAVLPDLIAARLAQRIMLPPLLGPTEAAHLERLTRTLENLLRMP